MIILETPRLILREMSADDLDAFASMYADPDVMRFIGNGETLTREQTQQSIENMHGYYEKYGFGLWTTVEKISGKILGRCGLLYWEIDEKPEIEIAYLIGKEFWGNGFATEAAQAIKEYAFANFDVPRLISLMYIENFSSANVAKKNGMRCIKELEMFGANVYIFSVER